MDRSSRRSRLGVTLALALGAGSASADVRIAFLGDQGADGAARAVLSLVRSEKVDLLVSLGDLGYGEGPSKWSAVMDSELGSNFPVLAVVGNHEVGGWSDYKRWLERRIDSVPDLSCRGDVGVKAHCTFRGISILQVAPGVHEVSGVKSSDDYAGYLRRELADDPNAWRICSWHKQMADMQVGSKGDSTGWDVYEACRAGGGIIATAHEHSYSRTHLLDDFANKRVVHRRDHLEIGPGQTFAFVSGLGGKSVRPQLRGGDWWASVYTATQGATHGALICSFDASRASCEFKAIDGAVPDRFTLETHDAAASGPGGEGTSPAPHAPRPGPLPSGALAAPSGLRAEVYSSRDAELFWDRSSTPGLRYEIRRDGATVANNDGTSHYERGLSGGRRYRYDVVAIDREGHRSAPASVTLQTHPSSARRPGPSAPADAVTRGSTILPGEFPVKLSVYDGSSYELIWARVPGARRYRLSSGNGQVVQNGEKVSRYFNPIDSSLTTDYRIEAFDRSGTPLRAVRVRVAPRSSTQLSSPLDQDRRDRPR